MNATDIARICHEANRALCTAHGDASQLPWEEAAQWQKDSAIKGVEYALANPDATGADQHGAWLRDKLANGWVYGPVKDAEKKTHPCIVSYVDLPLFQQAKDHLFRGVVLALTPFLDA